MAHSNGGKFVNLRLAAVNLLIQMNLSLFYDIKSELRTQNSQTFIIYTNQYISQNIFNLCQ